MKRIRISKIKKLEAQRVMKGKGNDIAKRTNKSSLIKGTLSRN